MPTIPYKNTVYTIYENTKEGGLVAIEKELTKNKKAKGYKFILDEEHNSLKIDFSKSYLFNLVDLKLFPTK